jgi:hypothetical protein
MPDNWGFVAAAYALAAAAFAGYWLRLYRRERHLRTRTTVRRSPR